MVLAKGSPSSIGPEWSAAENKDNDRQREEEFSINFHVITAHVQCSTVAVVWDHSHAKNVDVDDNLQR